MVETFDNILVWALPASGKSETFKFVESLAPEKRAALHLGEFVGVDDYPLVASLFRVDDACELAGMERIHTRKQDLVEGGFSHSRCWEMLDRHLAAEYMSLVHRRPNLYDEHTVLIECARGGSVDEGYPLPHGYFSTLGYLPDELLAKAVILYVKVSPEESKRKNAARYDPADPLGTMGHKVPDKVMESDYGCDDIAWMIRAGEAAGREGHIQSPGGLWVPIGVLDNNEDMTTWVRDNSVVGEARAEASNKLYSALEQTLVPLFERYQTLIASRADR